MVGIGFLVVEDVFYFMNSFVQMSGDMGSILQMFLIRVIGAGPYSHFLYTGLTGMGIAWYITRTDQTRTQRLLIGLGLAALGVGSHFLWNSPFLSSVAEDGSLTGFLTYATVKGLPILIGVAIVVRMARGRDRRWFERLAANPALAGDLPPDDLRELSGLWRRLSGRRAAGRAKGPAGRKLRGQIQREEIALALAASDVAGPQDAELLRRRATLQDLRARFDALPVLATGAFSPGSPGAAASAVAPAGWTPSVTPDTRGQVPGGGPTIAPTSAPALAAPAWAPTHRVPPEGMQAWTAPDPAGPPIDLGGGLPVAVAERLGDWARVVASNGWTGWVDARRLV